MDTTAALDRLRHPDSNPDDRHGNAADIAHCLRSGGFVPDGESRNPLLDEIDQTLGCASIEPVPDAHLEVAYDDRCDTEVDR